MTFEEIIKMEMDKLRPELNRLLLKERWPWIHRFAPNMRIKDPMEYEQIPLPRYNCHKEVKAFKIEEVDYRLQEATLIPEAKELLPVKVTMEWVSKHGPVLPGGYYVRYKDGYESYSPAAPFEEGYSLMEDK